MWKLYAGDRNRCRPKSPVWRAKYDRPVTRPMSPISTRRSRNQDSEFSPKIAKCKWERLEKYDKAESLDVRQLINSCRVGEAQYLIEYCLQLSIEHVETLRRRQKPMSTKVAGQVAKYDRPVTRPMSPISTRRSRNQDSEFSPKIAKCKWERLVKYDKAESLDVRQLINSCRVGEGQYLIEYCLQLSIEHVETLRRRQKPMSTKVAGQVAKYDRPVTRPMSPISTCRSRNQDSEFSPKIAKCKWERLVKYDKAESLDVRQLINSCRVGEAQYLIEYCLQLSIEHVETIRRRQKPMSTKVAGQVAKYDRPVTCPMSPISTRRSRNQDSEFSPKIAKCKWERLVKYDKAESLDVRQLINSCRVGEAQYLIEYCLQLSIEHVETLRRRQKPMSTKVAGLESQVRSARDSPDVPHLHPPLAQPGLRIFTENRQVQVGAFGEIHGRHRHQEANDSVDGEGYEDVAEAAGDDH